MSMINSVSGISFRGDVAPANDLINAPSKFSNPAPQAEAPADSFEKVGEKKKSKAPAIIGTIVGLAAIATAVLGFLVGRGKLTKVVAEEGKNLSFLNKAQNFVYDIGEKVSNWLPKVFKGSEKAAEATEKAAGKATEKAAEAGEKATA